MRPSRGEPYQLHPEGTDYGESARLALGFRQVGTHVATDTASQTSVRRLQGASRWWEEDEDDRML
eukprot:8959550-Prorocentrum_lima.AAC.1